MTLRRVAILIALAGPAGAAEKIAVPAIHMPAAYEGQTANGAMAPAALDRWWLLFDDPGLNALEDEAMRNGPDALTAAARVLEAKATRQLGWKPKVRFHELVRMMVEADMEHIRQTIYGSKGK